MENNLPSNFTNLLMALQYRKTYQKVIANAKDAYNLKTSNIQDLTPAKTLQLYRTIIKKFYMNRTIILEGSWFQNQLRVFLFVLIGYLYVHKKNLQQMQFDDWSYFSPIFNSRSPVSFEFQSRSILKHLKSPKWIQTQIEILDKIIKFPNSQFRQKKFKNKWNSIARQLFIRSNKIFYRTPKQCRERWLNYLDPQKKRTGWDALEDLTLLKTIQKNGKKWSKAVKQLKSSRTEHMVKNRYKSLIANESKKYNEMTQNQILKRLIKFYQQDLGLEEQKKIKSIVKIEQQQENYFQNPHIRTSHSYSENNNQSQTLKMDHKKSFALQNQSQFQNDQNQFLISQEISQNIPINEQYKHPHNQLSPTFQFDKRSQFQEEKEPFRFQEEDCEINNHGKINYFGDQYDCFR